MCERVTKIVCTFVVYAVIITPKYYKNSKNIFKIFKNLGDLDAISLRYYYYILYYVQKLRDTPP